jgi:hypothetical protein
MPRPISYSTYMPSNRWLTHVGTIIYLKSSVEKSTISASLNPHESVKFDTPIRLGPDLPHTNTGIVDFSRINGTLSSTFTLGFRFPISH